MPELSNLTWMWICFGLAFVVTLAAIAWPEPPPPEPARYDQYGYPLDLYEDD